MEQVPGGSETRRLVIVGGSITFSNASDSWTQRLEVEEWEVSVLQGNTILSRTAAYTSTSAGGWILNANGNLRLAQVGSSAEPLWGLWLDSERGVRVWKYLDAEGPAMSYDYHRFR